MHARTCSPLTGRFLSFDPVDGSAGAPQSWNRYAYVMNDPVNYVDPYGLSFVGMQGFLALQRALSLPIFFETQDVTATAPVALDMSAFARFLFTPVGPERGGGDYISLFTVRDVSAGLGDALLLGFGDELRDLTTDSSVDRCSSEYRVTYTSTTVATLVAGGARLAYAAAAKGLSYAARAKGTAEAALAAARARDSLKIGFRLGLDRTSRIVPAEQRLQSYGAQGLARAVGRTNASYNAAGAAAVAAAVNSLLGLPECE
jgi:hypothetical protein